MTNLKFTSGTGMTTVTPTNNSDDIEIRLPNGSCTLGTKEEIDNIDKYLFTNTVVNINVSDSTAENNFPTLIKAIQEALKYRLVGNAVRVNIVIHKDLNEYPIEISYKLLNNISITTGNVKRRWVVKNSNSKENVYLTAFTVRRCSGILEFNAFNMELEPEIPNQQLFFLTTDNTDVLFWYCNIRVLHTMGPGAYNGVISVGNNGFVNFVYSVLYVKLREPTYIYNSRLYALAIMCYEHGKLGCTYYNKSRDYYSKIVVEEPDEFVNPNNVGITTQILGVRTEGTISSRGIMLAWVGNSKKEAPILTRAKNYLTNGSYVYFLCSYSAGVIKFDYFEIGMYNITANLKPTSPEVTGIILMSSDRVCTCKLSMFNTVVENLVLKAVNNSDTLNITGGKGILKVVTPAINTRAGGTNYITFEDKYVTVENVTRHLYSAVPFNTYSKKGLNYIFNYA
ncbi:hypothetical protein ACVWU4_001032 [Campylobacter coli]